MIEFLFKKYYEKLNEKQRKLAKIFFFIINLHIFGLPLYLFNKFNPQFYSIQSIFAKFLAIIFNARSIGPYVYFNNYVFEISSDCIGIKSSLAWFSLTFSIPFLNPKKRFTIFIKYLPIILLFNFIRILSTVYLSLYFNPYFVHDIFWAIVLNVFLFSLFFYVLKKER